MDIEEAKELLKDRDVMWNNPENDVLEAVSTVLSELEKKDKIIELMAILLSCAGIEIIRKQFENEYCEFINSDEDCCWKTGRECSDCIIEYFTNKVEKEGK